MKTMQKFNQTVSYTMIFAATMISGGNNLTASPGKKAESEAVSIVLASGKDAAATNDTSKSHSTIVVKGIEPVHAGHPAAKEVAWLGVGTDEASEALTAQLGLEPGVGLVVSYVASNSPAAKAGLQKNDVLAEFEGQSLVLAAQLRKLVQARQEGDTAKLVYYRAGKKHTATATLGKTSAGFGFWGDERSWGGDLKDLQLHLPDLPNREAIRDAIRQQMDAVRKSLGNLKIDQKKMQAEIERSMEQARKAMHEAFRETTNANASTESVAKALKELEKMNLDLDKNTTVTIRNSGKRVKNIVKSDEAGTIAIISNPKLHLTAHDKDGKLVFDGEIETEDQRAKVPPDVWKQAEPLLEKLQSDDPKEEKEEKEELEKNTRATRIPAPLDGGDIVLNTGLFGGVRML